MAAMMALQGMGFPQLPAMPPLPIPPTANGTEPPGGKVMERCPFYDTQGICYLGTACPYQHGEEAATTTDDAGKEKKKKKKSVGLL